MYEKAGRAVRALLRMVPSHAATQPFFERGHLFCMLLRNLFRRIAFTIDLLYSIVVFLVMDQFSISGVV